MPEEIIIDGLEEHAFRRSIENMLRNGRADEAVERLKKLLPECAGEGKVLPGRLLELSPEDINLAGWDRLADRVNEYSRASTPITAIGIGIGDPADLGIEPDAEGNLRPPLATSFYSDATFPFSETDRADLLEGYSAFGCEWQGDHDRIDDTLAIEGIDDLYGAIVRLENDVANSDDPDSEDIRAGAIGACYLGVMVWQAARRAVIEKGLPRPMAILLVNSDAYPFFDAPVMTCEEYRDDGAIQVVTHETASPVDDFDTEEQEAASLVDLAGLGAHREKTKKMALVLDGAEAHNPLGMADDLVAQAAFDPNSVDITQFMPDASDFTNEPDAEELAALQHEPGPDTDEFAEAQFGGPDEPYDDLEFPVDAPDYTTPDEPQPRESAEDWKPESDRFGSLPEFDQVDDIFMPDPLEASGADSYSGADRWQPPEWATQHDDQPGFSADQENSGYPHPTEPEEFVPVSEDDLSDTPFATEPLRHYPAPQPASHSIRDRIRVAPMEELPQRTSDGPVARFLAWLGKLILRR
ncbi:MAG: hypothetical protein KDE32_03895 [Novosphingobium sp.]|nr:hypothetical protein [Novosphingobium sp.]